MEPCFDVAHLFARPGDGSVNSYEDWARALETYGSKLGEESLSQLHIHISGIEYGEKGEKEHQPLDDSEFDYKSFLKALKEFNCRGRILCESPILEEDALICKANWCEISGEDCAD